MASLVRDDNGLATMIRKGLGAGGMFTLNDGNWRRLMPDGNTAEVHATAKYRLNIGALPDDIVDIDDWRIIILNEGYKQEHFVQTYDGTYISLSNNISYYDALSALGQGIEWVLFPKVIVPISLKNLANNRNDEVRIGVIKDDKYIAPATSSTEIKERFKLHGDTTTDFSFSRVDKIFIRNTRDNPSTNTIDVAWGESLIRNS